MKDVKFPNTARLMKSLIQHSTKHKLARSLNMTAQFFGRLANGGAGVPSKKVKKLSAGLGCDPKRFLKAATLDFALNYRKNMKL